MNFEEACEIFASRDAARFVHASETIVTAAKNSLAVEEVSDLARALAASGAQIALSSELHPLADVPSTGGPASLTTLLCPFLIAGEGVRVPKLSANGSIGGAIDSMALIPGFQTRLSEQHFIEILAECGFAHAEQTLDFCPADRSLIEARRRARMMPNPSLAAASLLGKKLVVPGTAAAFDFRVGPTGNIGNTTIEATAASELFHLVAKQLDIPIAIVLTDNMSFPCGALGRMESLELLNNILTHQRNELSINIAHRTTCVRLAARACALVRRSERAADIERRMTESLSSGKTLELFGRHLAAQGTSLRNFQQLLSLERERDHVLLAATKKGHWIAPDIAAAKDWVKAANKSVHRQVLPDSILAEVGIMLLRSPNELVEVGDPVMRIGFPRGASLPSRPQDMFGDTALHQHSTNRGVLAFC